MKEVIFILTKAKYSLSFPLTDFQKKAAKSMLETLKTGKSMLLQAVCGAGKTEILFPIISACIAKDILVGLAIPRVDVVKELEPRLKKAFKSAIITAVYGGHTSSLIGDVIILTTHQLFRFKRRFGLVIIDEVDAFPFWGNQELTDDALASSKLFIYMSATPPSFLLEQVKVGKLGYHYLKKRYHNMPLPIPKVYRYPPFFAFLSLIYLSKKWISAGRKVLIYVPTIAIGSFLFPFLRLLIPELVFISSKNDERAKIIESFKKGHPRVLLTTIVLERGITIRGVDVLVYRADHPLFKADNLIQISGRVGRDKTLHSGNIIFYGKKNQEIVKSIKAIEYANS
jgi:competence protein ComFA